MQSTVAWNQRRIGAWLALLAMLLLCVGPLLSQGLRAASLSDPQACGEHGAGSASHSSGEPHRHEAPWASCGYCTLLFGSPALVAPTLGLARAGQVAGLPTLLGQAQQVPEPAVFPGARSHAPPVLS